MFASLQMAPRTMTQTLRTVLSPDSSCIMPRLAAGRLWVPHLNVDRWGWGIRQRIAPHYRWHVEEGERG
jgi:hypothetical protein